MFNLSSGEHPKDLYFIKSMNTTDSKENILGTQPVLKLIFKFAVPTIISMLVTTAYNITDQIFIGNIVGLLGNAATNICFPVVTLVLAFAQLLGVGTAANFNINQGAKKEEEAKRFLTCGLALAAVAGIAIGVFVFIFRSPIVLLCGSSETVYPYALSYLTFTSIGIPFSLFTTFSAFIIRSDGSPGYSMMCTVSGAVINIGLDAFFMYVLKMEITGAALATSISQMISCVICIVYFPKFRAFKIRLKELRLRGSYTAGIMKLGLPNFINQMSMMVVDAVQNNMIKNYGALSEFGSDIPLAISGVAAKLNSILVSFAVGLSMGSQPIWSYNLGAKKYDRVKEAHGKALIIALIIGAVFFLAVQIFPRQLISIFGGGDELYYRFAERYMHIYFLLITLYCIQPLTVNYFTGTGNVRLGTVMSLSRKIFFMLPLLIILPLFFGLDGVLYASPASEALAFTLACILLRRNFMSMGT